MSLLSSLRQKDQDRLVKQPLVFQETISCVLNECLGVQVLSELILEFCRNVFHSTLQYQSTLNKANRTIFCLEQFVLTQSWPIENDSYDELALYRHEFFSNQEKERQIEINNPYSVIHTAFICGQVFCSDDCFVCVFHQDDKKTRFQFLDVNLVAHRKTSVLLPLTGKEDANLARRYVLGLKDEIVYYNAGSSDPHIYRYNLHYGHSVTSCILPEEVDSGSAWVQMYTYAANGDDPWILPLQFVSSASFFVGYKYVNKMYWMRQKDDYTFVIKKEFSLGAKETLINFSYQSDYFAEEQGVLFVLVRLHQNNELVLKLFSIKDNYLLKWIHVRSLLNKERIDNDINMHVFQNHVLFIVRERFSSSTFGNLCKIHLSCFS